LSEDDNYYYYSTNLTSFSYFAIGEKSLVNGQASGTTQGTNLTWLWIVIGIVVLVAIAFVIMKRKK
jgi:LPXTG-motif cell wall-anchored protein